MLLSSENSGIVSISAEGASSVDTYFQQHECKVRVKELWRGEIQYRKTAMHCCTLAVNLKLR